MSDANSSAEESAFEFESEGEAEEDEAGLAPVEEKKAAKKIAAIFLKKAPENKTKAGWKAGDPVPYSALTETFEKIEATTKRLEILQHLTLLLQQVSERSPDNLLRIVYLCINRLCPDYEGLELGIGESLLMKAIAQSTGREMSRIRKELEQKGDLGLVAVASRQEQPTMFKAAKLSVPTVFKSLKEIAQLTGNKSQDRKIGIIMKLLAACQGEETKYLIRSLEGKLRIGLAEKSVVVALAQAIIYSKQVNKKLSEAALAAKLDEGTATVRAVFSELPSYDLIVPALLEYGVEGLRDHCKLTPGVPLKPMLAKPTKAIGEVLDRFEGKAFTCEYKYDGERAQVHYLENGQLAIFSRNSENMSVKYPDLIESVPKIRKADKDVKSFCLDCEAVAWKMPEFDESGTQTGGGHLLPFQELARRKRKDVKVEDIKVKVKLFAFDILYLNGEPLLHLDLATRRKLLHENFQPVENEFDFARSEDCTTVEEIQTFLDASVKDSCEGLMVKMLNGAASTYAPSQRSQNWLKLKKDYLAGTGDSLDLIVVGAFYGKGKRTNVYGAFLLACYDADTETYQSICKIGTGFSEEQLLQFYQLLKPLELSNKKGYYDMGDAKPDVFFEPQVIFEVLTADLSLSPVYTAGKGAVDQRGISLRFPRFIRLRDDKGPEDTTSPEQIIEMYQRQQAVSNGRTKGGDDEDGFW
ncbi:ATP-dependent DNA ligase [Tilletiaria anomala UBC 951]|uniref:DNA ligase n=1 Tax=Tilletiaria anomala (strain ATCC 24038 / CBS 436.72 / UBC 951) TaxID=1037660 RepID=A0A066VNC6_TILAU|nr:ATP-dependent DNA ligase [Tilletiaria anomala UBC 951]KDN40090.1 ATP-dependent DNA ligase [Tilletiaria anomala UBC 951]